MKVWGPLERAQIENLAADPAAGVVGRIWWNTVSLKPMLDDGTNSRALLRNDQKIIIGSDATANNNSRINRSAAGALQLVPGGDATAEGAAATSLNQLGFRLENYTTAGSPAFGNAGRLIWNTTLSTVQADTGASLKDLVVKDLAQVITNKDIDGGTASNTNRFTAPKSTKASLDALTRKEATLVYATDTKKVYFDDGSLLNQVGAGSGLGINYVTNSDAEVDTSGWSVYADAAGASPVDGTGGSPTTTLTRIAAGQLRGLAGFQINKPATNNQGEGISTPITIDAADNNAILAISFDFSGSISPTQFTTGDNSDVKVFIYDITNATLIQPSKQSLDFASGKFQATFPTNSSTAYRLILHIATTVATAWGLKIDNVQVGPQTVVFGPAMTDFVPFTMVVEGTTTNPTKGTTTIDDAKWKRVGDRLQGTWIYKQIAAGANGSGNYIFKLPTGLSFASDVALGTTPATGQIMGAGSWNNSPVNSAPLVVFAYDATHFALYYSAAPYLLGQTAGAGFGATADYVINIQFEAKISGWSTNVVSANSSVFNISNVLANGTRVTTTPAALGEYRSQLRNASLQTYTDTNGTPTALPSSTDGIKMYSGNAFNAVDTNNQPTKYQIFVGKNKTVRPQYYQSAGRTGFIDVSPVYYSGGRDYGLLYNYDPTTGVSEILAYRFGGAGQLHSAGIDDTNTNIDNCYFDIIVSENALAVQQAPNRSEVWITNGNGHGSTNTVIRRFSNTQKNIGTDITYADSATLGATFTINQSGVYSIAYEDADVGAGSYFGLSLNSAQLTTTIASVAFPTKLIQSTTPGTNTNFGRSLPVTTVFSKGDVIRPHTDGGPASTTDSVSFRITKVSG